jgi:hypothetical protein
MTRSPNRALIGAAAAFTVALFVFGSALVRALGFGADDTLAPRAATETPSAASNSSDGLDTDALMLAVENDPFQPDRTRPAERYRMPGDVEPEEPAPPPPPPPVPDFRLVGTVVFGPENGTAAIAVGDADPRMMNVGETVMGYRVIAVTPQTATVSNGEREILLRVPAPSSALASSGRAGANGRAGPGGGRAGAQPGRTPQQQAQLQQLLQRAAQSGAPPQILQQLERLMATGNAAGMLDAMKMMESMSTREDVMEFTIPGQGGVNRVQVRPAPRRDSVVVRRPGGGGGR